MATAPTQPPRQIGPTRPDVLPTPAAAAASQRQRVALLLMGPRVLPAASAQAMLTDLAQAQPARPEALLALRPLDAAAC